MTNVERIVADAAKLSDEEKRRAAEGILELVHDADPAIEEEWMQEAKRRFEAHDAGETKSAPWEEARARIFARP
jgi:putative addiction module component (TIGR02574 family)